MKRTFLILALGTLFPKLAAADIGAEFSVKQVADPKVPAMVQKVYVKDGFLLVKSAGGDANVDMLFRQANAMMTIISHSDKTYLDIDEKRMTELVTQAEGMMAAIQRQLADQLANMPPDQAARLREMLGGMGNQPGATAPPEPKKYIKKGKRTINGFACEQYEIIKAQRKASELCLAKPEALGISAKDYGTVQALKAFGARLAEQASRIAQRFGGDVPEFGSEDLKGVPVELKDLSGPVQTIMRLTKVNNNVTGANFTVPAGYQARQLGPATSTATQKSTPAVKAK